MALGSLLTPVVSAFLGAVSGLFSGLTSERFKGLVTAVDKELERIDQIQDSAVDVLTGAVKGQSTEVPLRQISLQRSRLGQNLRRHLGSSDRWTPISTNLGLFGRSLKDVQDIAEPPRGVDLAGDAKVARSEEIEQELADRALALRSAVRLAASKNWVWRLLRN